MSKHTLSVSCLSVLSVIGIILLSSGCGSTDESTQSTTTWTQASQPAANAGIDYTIDSLARENRLLKQQLDAIVRENKTLASQTKGLEVRLTEALLRKGVL